MGHNTIKSGVTVENCATSPHLKTARRRGCVFNFKLHFQKELVLDCASTLSYTCKSRLCWLGGGSISSRPKCSPTARFADLFCFLNPTQHSCPIAYPYHTPR